VRNKTNKSKNKKKKSRGCVRNKVSDYHKKRKKESGDTLFAELGKSQLIRILKLGGVNHHQMRKWLKTAYVPESTYHRETFPPQRRWIPPKAGL
jgi:hypothetical protein